MLKQSYVIVLLDIEVESSSQDKIQVDIKEPLESPRQFIAQQQEELGSDSGKVQDSDGVQDYTSVHGRDPCHICRTPILTLKTFLINHSFAFLLHDHFIRS